MKPKRNIRGTALVEALAILIVLMGSSWGLYAWQLQTLREGNRTLQDLQRQRLVYDGNTEVP